ncbi:serine/threonine-protein kinase [Nocardia carnea]|uniref:serine/threonine-protein kinase n=1 Tax=Nocardia carnea TaxID=37328 RepID=UPI002455C9D2|nr:serine/threonine-protein kinase [Nocardia carnea]
MSDSRLGPDDPQQLGPYRIVDRLGAGGMGDVFLARSPADRLVAIKAIHRHLAGDREFLARFAREVQAARAVGGFYTAAVVDADPEATRPWLATEYIPAPSLKQVVAQHGPLPESAAGLLAIGITEALGAIHAAGIVHRDLTPANILLAQSGPRVIDFGIARALAQTHSLTATGSVIGSPGHMSPEHILGEEVGPAGDLFSLGTVLAFAITGRGVFGQAPVGVMMHRVLHDQPDLTGIPDGRLYRIIVACLAKDPAARPGVEQVLAALGHAPGATLPTAGWLPPHMTATRTPTGSRVGRRTIIAAAGLAGLGLLGAAALGAAKFLGDDEPAASTATIGPPAGTVRWRTDIGAIGGYDPVAPPVADGNVFAGSIDGKVYALDVRTGEVRWQADMGYEISSVPVVVGDVVIASAITKGAGAFDRSTGALRWRADVDPTNLWAGGDPASVFAVADSGYGIVALDGVTGQPRWTALTDQLVQMDTSIAFGRGNVFVTIDSAVWALDAATGGVRWRAEVGWPAQPFVTGATVLITGPIQESMQALSAESGTPLWTFERDRGEDVTVFGDTIYLTSELDKIYALELGTGAFRWMVHTDATPIGAPVVTGGTIYQAIGTRVHALDAAGGEQRWATEVGAIQSGVTVVDGAAYVAANQHVYALAV